MKIIIPGTPVPQARMRHSNFKGFVTTYDPNAKDKKNIRQHLEKQKPSKLFENPRISFLFHMPILKGTKKKDLPTYNSGVLKHVKKPDVDNLIKLYLDCLDGIFLDGDQRVSLGPSLKVYHPEPKTIIWLHETTQVMEPWELDGAFLVALELSKLCFCEKTFLPGSYIPDPLGL